MRQRECGVGSAIAVVRSHRLSSYTESTKVKAGYNKIMLKSYEAIYEKGQVKWLVEEPAVSSARILVTVLEENPSPQAIKHRQPSAVIAGKGKTLGDIISPIVDEDDWECLK